MYGGGGWVVIGEYSLFFYSFLQTTAVPRHEEGRGGAFATKERDGMQWLGRHALNGAVRVSVWTGEG